MKKPLSPPINSIASTKLKVPILPTSRCPHLTGEGILPKHFLRQTKLANLGVNCH